MGANPWRPIPLGGRAQICLSLSQAASAVSVAGVLHLQASITKCGLPQLKQHSISLGTPSCLGEAEMASSVLRFVSFGESASRQGIQANDIFRTTLGMALISRTLRGNIRTQSMDPHVARLARERVKWIVRIPGTSVTKAWIPT
jgi:hypothetical protein